MTPEQYLKKKNPAAGPLEHARLMYNVLRRNMNMFAVRDPDKLYIDLLEIAAYNYNVTVAALEEYLKLYEFSENLSDDAEVEYFDGKIDQISSFPGAFALGTGDFTIDFWPRPLNRRGK